MQKVLLKTFLDRGQTCVGIYYAKDHLLNQLLSIFEMKGISVETESNSRFQRRKTELTIPTKTPSRVNKSIDEKSDFNAIVEPVNMHVLKAMKDHLIVKAYSSSTIKTCINEMQQLLYRLGKIPADDLKPEHLKRYFVYFFKQLHLSENTMRSRMNAIKFYYEQVLHREQFFWEIPRPKKPMQLP